MSLFKSKKSNLTTGRKTSSIWLTLVSAICFFVSVLGNAGTGYLVYLSPDSLGLDEQEGLVMTKDKESIVYVQESIEKSYSDRIIYFRIQNRAFNPENLSDEDLYFSEFIGSDPIPKVKGKPYASLYKKKLKNQNPLNIRSEKEERLTQLPLEIFDFIKSKLEFPNQCKVLSVSKPMVELSKNYELKLNRNLKEFYGQQLTQDPSFLPIAASHYLTRVLALSKEGKLMIWNPNSNLDPNDSNKIVPEELQDRRVLQIAVAGGLNAVLLEDRKLYYWGHHRRYSKNMRTPVPYDGKKFRKISTSYFHPNLLIGILQNGSPEIIPVEGVVPEFLKTLPEKVLNGDLLDLQVGIEHGLALFADGKVFAWGTGPGATLPPEILMTPMKMISAGPEHNLFLKLDGKIAYDGKKVSIPKKWKDRPAKWISAGIDSDKNLALFEDGAAKYSDKKKSALNLAINKIMKEHINSRIIGLSRIGYNGTLILLDNGQLYFVNPSDKYTTVKVPTQKIPYGEPILSVGAIGLISD